jgi:membrane fusion protein, multidrug efflux system
MAPDEGARVTRDYDKDDRESRGDEHREKPQDNESSDSGEQKRTFFSNRYFQIGAALVALGAIAVGVVWWLNARKFEDTDDAFVDAHIVHLSPQVAGRVTAIHVTDNQLVHKGDPLLDIDAADFDAKLMQAKAQQIQAETQLLQNEASEKGVDAQAENAERDLERYQLLKRTSPQAVAQQQLDQAVATERNTKAQLAAAQAQIVSAQAQIAVYKAAVDAAQLDVGYTRIVSPVDGHITQRTVATGNYVSPGQALMAIVPLDLWVTANFKETQLARMRVGQPVTITVDSCADREINGHIDSLQRGAGQAFGILPPENATGNYVKVVQRVPVKIVLDNLPQDCPLGPGMSVVPSVKVR